MEVYRVTFAGHRMIDSFFAVEKMLDDIIERLIKENEFVEFYVGNDGEFDVMATSAIRRARARLGAETGSVSLVLPYTKADIDLFERQFDSVLIPDELYGVHQKQAINMRNRWMVDNCDLLICYVRRESGGAAATMRYAQKLGRVKMQNLADEIGG